MSDNELKLAFAVRMDAMLKVRPFVSTNDSSYYLSGVFVQPAIDGVGVLCVAMNGYQFGVQRSADAICNAPTICKLPAGIKMPIRSKLKETHGRSPWLVCMSSGSMGHLSVVPALKDRDADTAEYAAKRIESAEIRFGNTVIDGIYPDWQKVVPRETEGIVRRAFNAEYIASFGPAIQMSGNSDSSPHLIRTTDTDFLGVLMPMRWDVPHGIPDWLPAQVSK